MKDIDKIIECCDEILDGNADGLNVMRLANEIKDCASEMSTPPTIIMERFDDNFADYYDMEKDSYIIYAGRGKIDFDISVKANIQDAAGTIWHCYLWKAEYVPHLDAYELEYKAY